MNVFDLAARITLDTSGYEDALGDAQTKTSGFADKLKSGLGTAAKAGAVAIGAASTAFGVLGKAAIANYADYEQLVGGVETLFKDSAEQVQQYADNAYKTAGMSANAYMETVTSFSASLLQGLDGDTEAAAKIANRAITDMSDNANKMGTDMSMIENAYQGFAKQNYTMLDNLKLGYGGTQAEMARLINESGVLGNSMTVTAKNVNEVSFDKIIEAIGVVQDRMGITGTTAKEAASTISGSVGMMKAAWANFLTGMADPEQDFGALLDNLVSSVETVAGNILPRVTMFLSGIGDAITKVSPILSTEIPKIITSIIPDLVDAGAQMVVGLFTGLVGALPELAKAVPDILETFVGSIEQNSSLILDAGKELLDMLLNGIMNGIPILANSAVSFMTSFGQYLRENLPTLLETGLEFITEFSALLRSNAGLLIDGALSLVMALADGLIASIPTLIETVPTIVSNIANIINDNAPKIIATGLSLIAALASGIVSAIPVVVDNMPQIISAIWDTITAINWMNLGEAVINGFSAGIKAMGSFIKGVSEGIGTSLKTGVRNLPGDFLKIGQNIIQGLINGLKSMVSGLLKSAKEIATSIVSTVTTVLGIHSPSTVFAGIGENMALGMGEGWDSEFGRIKKDIAGGLDFGTANVDFASSGFGAASAGIVNGVAAAAATGGSTAPMTFNLMFPDMTRFASYTFQPLVNYAKANGTPILNPS